MTRSVKKRPFTSNSTARSEKDDKRLWHQRARSRQRHALSVAKKDHEAEIICVAQNEVSNPRGMSKDGRHYWPLSKQVVIAKRRSKVRGKTPQERKAIAQRLLHKFMGK